MDEVIAGEGTHFAVTLNGKQRDVACGHTVAELLEELDLRERLVVVERNGTIVSRADFPATLLAAGDVLEIVHFVGGG